MAGNFRRSGPVLHGTTDSKEDWLTRALQKQLTPEERKQLADAISLLQRLAEWRLAR